MQILSLLIAAYGALVASGLAYLTYRREGRRIRLRFMLEAGNGPPGLAVYIVNLGIRDATVRSGGFFWHGEKGGFGPDFSRSGVLPARLSDGDELRLWVPIIDVVNGANGFVVEDTTGRKHRQQFSPAFVEQIAFFRQWIEEATQSS